MHKYNNQDHAMMTAMLTAKNILAGERVYDIWNVNEDAEYHEAGGSGVKEALGSRAAGAAEGQGCRREARGDRGGLKPAAHRPETAALDLDMYVCLTYMSAIVGSPSMSRTAQRPDRINLRLSPQAKRGSSGQLPIRKKHSPISSSTSRCKRQTPS